MIKITEEKLLAFEAFLNHQKNDYESAFDAFMKPNKHLLGKSVCDSIEEGKSVVDLLKPSND